MKNIGCSKAAPADDSSTAATNKVLLLMTQEINKKPNSSSSSSSSSITGIIGHWWWHFTLMLNYYYSRFSWQLLLLRSYCCNNNNNKRMRGGKSISGKSIFLLCMASFLAGSLFFTSGKDKDYSTTTRSSVATTFAGTTPPGLTQLSIGRRAISSISSRHHHEEHQLINALTATNTHNADADGCDHKPKKLSENKSRSAGDVMEEVRMTHEAIQSLDKKISTLEMELAASRTQKAALSNYTTSSTSFNKKLKKAFVVIGINTAFSSKKRRDSLRQTWLPKGKKLKKLEKEKGIVIRFVIGHSATPGGGGVLDRGIDAENAEYNDFLRLNHVEGYHQLSTKTRLFFSTAVSIWDAHFYVKVDDDVHVNLGTLVNTLGRYKSHPRTYIGCMKSGPVLSQKGIKYHEPEFWKFGEEGNKYFRHATGQIYAISKDLALYISINSGILHRYANEDVSLGSWLIGLEVQHVDDRSMCCATPPECEWKRQGGNACIASFDWSCSGICNSVERMKDVHNACGEEDEALWNLLVTV